MLRRLVRYKVYFDRSRMYYGYAQFMLVILLLFKGTKYWNWIIDNWYLTLPALVIIIFGIALVIGFFDKRYVRPLEQEEHLSTNHAWDDMMIMLSDIKRKMK